MAPQLDLVRSLAPPQGGAPAPARPAGAVEWPVQGLRADVSTLLSTEQARSLVPAAFLGIAALDAVPTPTDIGFFWGEAKLREREGSLSPRAYWLFQAANYYGWDILWYSTLFAVTATTGRTLGEKARVGGGLLAAGAIASMLYRYGSPEPHARHPAKRRRRHPSRPRNQEDER